MKLTIIPVTFNSADHIEETISSLEAAIEGMDAEILVVDNDSQDETVSLAEKRLRRGRVIELDDNIGFGPGANIGLAHAQGEFALIMNDDVHPVGDCLQQLIDVLESDQTIGLVGPKMLHPDGSSADATRPLLPSLRDEWARIKDALSNKDRRNTYPEGSDPVDVGLLIAAFVMGRSQQLRRIGGFNNRFFFYGEDIDLCRRLHANGLRTVTVPSASAIHDQTVATERRFAGRDFVRRILDARSAYYRIWLTRVERTVIHIWRALGPSDQPFRFRYHMRRALWDGASLKDERSLPQLRTDEPVETRHGEK